MQLQFFFLPDHVFANNKLWSNQSQQPATPQTNQNTQKKEVQHPWFPLLKLHTAIYQYDAPNEEQKYIKHANSSIITDINPIARALEKNNLSYWILV